MEINYWAVLVCAVLSMVVGFLWYGPLFGKKWMEVMGADKATPEQKKEMMKNVWKLYLTQFLLTLFQVWVLAWYVGALKGVTPGINNALWIWAAFVIPTTAGASMWNNDSSKIAWSKFLLQGGYQLVIFVMFGLILGAW